MPSLIGAPVDRLGGVAKVTGTACYAADVKLPGQLYALSLRSPIAAGAISQIDTSAAEAVPTVAAVYTHRNAAEALGWRQSADLVALGAEGLGLQALTSDGAARPNGYLPLTSPDIHFAGQWVAVVVAGSIEAAQEAVALIRVVYDPAAHVIKALPHEPALRPGYFFASEMQVARGSAPPVTMDDRVVAETYTTPMQLHQPMEPSATTANWTGEAVTLHDSTQGVLASRDYVAVSLGIPKHRVRVVSPHVGGGFGAKNQVWPHQALAAHLARALGQPVRMQLTRADMAVASGHRSFTEQSVMLQADARNGDLQAVRHISHVPTSQQGGFFEPCGLNTLLLYGSGAVEVQHHVHRRNIPTPTPFRGPGETPGSFAMETALDELAFALRLDPLVLRHRCYADHDAHHGRAWSSNHLRECYRLGAEVFGWPAGPVVPRARRDGDDLLGVGMATTAYPAQAVAATVRVRLQRDGRVIVETSATDIGTGMSTILAQTIAEELGLPLDDIDARLGDSDLPHAPTAGRSKSMASVLPAARLAARNLLNKLGVTGAERPPRSNVSIAELLAGNDATEMVAEGTFGGMPQDQDCSFYSFGVHFVEVRVDEAIGRLRVSRIVSAFDCGRIINPKTAASQIKGAIIFGIGMALMEKAEFDPVHGRLVNDNLADYHLPVHADIPDIDVLFIEHPDVGFNEFGARGLGEIGLPGVAAAIGNAFFSATGRRVRHLPISIEQIVTP
jgi:xanthine dehydrogenase YagR molybdenum-binding subunit